MKIFSEFQKNAKERLRVSHVQYKGHELIDLRVCWQDNDGNWMPGRKGLTFSPEILPQIIEVLKLAQENITGSDNA